LILWVDDALFDGPVRDVDRLALLRNAALRRHTLIVSATPTAPWGARPTPHFDSWLGALPTRLRAEVRLLRERTNRVSANSITRGAPRLLVAEHPLEDDLLGCWLPLTDAVRAVAQPLHILVEHQINDAAFLRRAMPPAWRRRFQQWEQRGELRYENGGGLPVMAAIVEYFTNDVQARLAFGLPADVWRLVHFIVFDHDGHSRDHPGEQAGKLTRCCADKGMKERSHRLKRRDQEHYLPLEALKMIVKKRITDATERGRLLEALDEHFALGEERHFVELPHIGQEPFFKNEFVKESHWPDDWFARDGVWPEMTRLAERIASAI
jgi:hypothetical protein